jgi:PGF-pre-PGF domain-containing protein
MLKRIVIFMILVLLSAHAVAAADNGIEVSPGKKLSFELKPGAQAEQSIYVTNSGSESVSYEIDVDNAAYDGWFSISPSSFSLESGDTQTVKITLSVPSSAKSDVDCKLLIFPTSGNVNVAVKIPVSINVLSSSSGGSSSGSSSSGGGAGGSPEPASNVESKELVQQFVTNGNRIKFEFTDKATPVLYVEFDAKKSAGKITTIVEELKERSSLTSGEPEGEVYKWINIWVGNSGFATQENIENCVVGFRVSKDWVEENNIDLDSIVLQRFANETWNSLSTTKTDEDDEYFYFEAETPGFSPFAITGKKTGSVSPSTEVKTNINNTKSNVENQNESSSENGNEGNRIPGFGSILTGIGFVISAVLAKKK